MKSDVRGTRVYLPASDGPNAGGDPRRGASRQPQQRATSATMPPVPAPSAQPVAPASRWSGYRPVTAVVVAILALVVALDALRTPQHEARREQAANQLTALTSADDLRDTGRRALALVNFPWHDLGYEIVFAPARPGVRAQTDVVAHRITVFLARGDAAHRVAHDIGHELGHAYDARYLSEADRNAYLVARGKPKANWFPGAKFSDYDTGAGDFAEVFASCHAASPEFRSRLATKPAQPCSLIPTPRPGVK